MEEGKKPQNGAIGSRDPDELARRLRESGWCSKEDVLWHIERIKRNEPLPEARGAP